MYTFPRASLACKFCTFPLSLSKDDDGFEPDLDIGNLGLPESDSGSDTHSLVGDSETPDKTPTRGGWEMGNVELY